MNKGIKEHLESITEENFKEFKDDMFHVFASSSGKGKTVAIGVDGYGIPTTQIKEGNNTKKSFHKNFQQARKAYEKSLLE